MNIYKIIIVVAITQSCASHTLVVTSNTPTRVEVGGVTVCESTPCKIVNTCFKHGERTYLEAFPIDKSKGYTQTKVVSADCAIGSENATPVFFEMSSREGVAVEKSEISYSQKSSQAEPGKVKRTEEEKEKDLRFLKKMHEEGNFDDQTYKELVKKAVEQN